MLLCKVILHVTLFILDIIDSQKIKTQDGSYDLDKLTDDQLIKMYELTPETDLSLQEI